MHTLPKTQVYHIFFLINYITPVQEPKTSTADVLKIFVFGSISINMKYGVWQILLRGKK